MLTAPLLALSRPGAKFRQSVLNQLHKEPPAQDPADRLYDRSKVRQQLLRKDGLRFLTTMMKELNQNYDMFEKR